ncbi:hypothetical protein FRC18_006898 [Serendipita sp. 400]|nr:hypothetical protein FRC18_006898 [Serendipita sp. 400]
MSSEIVLHHLENSRSQRVLWLLEELQVPYTIKHYKRLPTQLAPPELKKIHPLGKSPIITDGDLVIAESGAIVEYLIGKYGKGRFQPPEQGNVKNLYYTHYAEGTLQNLLSNWRIYGMIPERVPWPIRWLIRIVMTKTQQAFLLGTIEASTEMVEKDLEQSPTGWIAGGAEPTSADFMLLFPLEALPRAMGTRIPPKIKAWVNSAHSRDAFQRALEKGGEYAYAKRNEVST